MIFNLLGNIIYYTGYYSWVITKRIIWGKSRNQEDILKDELNKIKLYQEEEISHLKDITNQQAQIIIALQELRTTELCGDKIQEEIDKCQ